MKTAVITGANRGIGLALAERLSQQGYRIIGVCRHSSDELNAIAEQVIENIDVTSAEAVTQLQQALADTPIDLLINNAGLLEDNVLGSIDFDSIQRMMDVNAYAPLRVTEALVANLKPGSKVGMITSRMGSIADNTSGGRYGYRASKAALNAFGKSLAEDLKPKEIAVALLHPGYVQTRMVGFGGLIAPQEAADGLVARLDELTLENSGSFWHSNGERLPW
ncbi:SDR family oxidoreductase [Reinekea blandensis]|uniref:Short-chain alcohol dehydrogenase-like protein n=1 Tax=Reinekea blandensis MED297 TaxID=314283 RepID=A4BJZ5_9GAMM|nr:SDR family oxidoreductase [Reinekea blandensis]EAR07528.1 short-chain alcohol dehydrogenase-like protein [Reinekea sp. MED297] [Reinekea blandensis MED297]